MNSARRELFRRPSTILDEHSSLDAHYLVEAKKLERDGYLECTRLTHGFVECKFTDLGNALRRVNGFIESETATFDLERNS